MPDILLRCCGLLSIVRGFTSVQSYIFTRMGPAFLPRDAYAQRGICCGAVSVRLSVCLSRWCTASK